MALAPPADRLIVADNAVLLERLRRQLRKAEEDGDKLMVASLRRRLSTLANRAVPDRGEHR